MVLFLLLLVTCVSMILKDGVGTFLTVAEARGNERLAGKLDPLGTLAGLGFYSFGAVQLIAYGWVGGICLLPVLLIDYIDGRFFTAVGRHIKSDENGDSMTLRALIAACKKVALQWIAAAVKWVKSKI